MPSAGGDRRVVEEQLVEIAHAKNSRQSGLAARISMDCSIIGVTRVSAGASDGTGGSWRFIAEA